MVAEADNGWITDEYAEFFDNIVKFVKDISDVERGIRYFTPHDSSHCYSVENIVKDLVKKSKVKLNNLEKFILLSSVWTHDLGMVSKIAKEFSPGASIVELRDKHDEISTWYLNNRYKEIFGLEDRSDDIVGKDRKSRVERYIKTINLVIKYHRRKEDINNCPLERYIENDQVRARLLACFLRFGDTLHVDLSRFDKEYYDILQIGNFDRIARLHWLKSFVVSNIYLDDKSETIFINIDLPEFKGEDKKDFEEGYEKLSNIIKEDIQEDLLNVNDTFRNYNLTCYNAVKPLVNLIPGYSVHEQNDILDVINDIEILLSPSDSKVVKKAISSIKSICRTEFETYEFFYNQTEQLIQHLKTIYNSRPSHVGLGKIIKEMEVIFRDNFERNMNAIPAAQITELQQIIDDKINEIDRIRTMSEEQVYDQCASHLKEIKNLFVCGISDMVTNFIDKYSKLSSGSDFKNDVNIYVLEFGGKRRFLNHNIVEYNDGIQYSIQLRKKGFRNVTLMPDTSFASCINTLLENGDIEYGRDKGEKQKCAKNTLVLFGANGIDEKGNVGHTSGHLMVAIVADYFNVPVKVVASHFKKGEIDWKLSAETQRKGFWLTGQKNILQELDNYNIELTNYAEDKVPSELIDACIS